MNFFDLCLSKEHFKKVGSNSTMSLANLNIPIALNTSKNNLVENFFVPLLQNSALYDRGVGYFSSGWIKETFEGMFYFAVNGGKARWITSPILSKEDWDALVIGNEAKGDGILKKALETAIDDLSNSLEKETLLALSWMIADGIIQFKLAKPRNKLTSEFHAKVGIFTDLDGNSISFDGSYNDSINGLHNFESIKVFRSWDSTAEYVKHEKELFEQIWNNEDPNIQVFSIPDAIEQQILNLRDDIERPYPKPEWLKLKAVREYAGEIIIPTPHKPENIKLRGYQEEAIRCWFNNQYKGVLEMATGTGKTITALSAAVHLLEKESRLFTIIVCPYIHLAQQWMGEAENFGYRPVLVAESRKRWLESAYKLVRDFRADSITHASLITTNASFLSSDLRDIIGEYDIWENVLMIADEVHHCGSQEMLKVLPEKIPYRLGLSATPIRGYDETGTERLLDYFGEIIYQFDLEQAIAQGFLTPYCYYPTPVHLTDDEFDEFIILTRKLTRMHPDPEKPMSEDALKIAIKRARVLNNSQSKVDWIRKNIESSNDYSYTLFYVGDQIFDDVRKLIGFEKRIPIHEFTHRQSLSERKNLIDNFAKGIIQAFVAMKCLDEGVDVPPTRTAYFLASSSVSREFIQRRGRILRNYPGKQLANVYDLISVPPAEYLYRGKSDENYKAVRSAIRREYLRIKEFASLAENKHQALGKFLNIINEFDLLDI